MSVLAAKPNTTVAFTDGACKGNPGNGGWGVYLVFADGQTQSLFGGEPQTTNNRMELMGAIQALQNSSANMKLEIWTDSSYVQKGITTWIHGWKQKGWMTASKKPVANQELWQRLDALCQSRDVDWHWIKGHAGHEGNEKADELANQGAAQATNMPSQKHTPASSQQLTSTLDTISSNPLRLKTPQKTNNNMDENNHIRQPQSIQHTTGNSDWIDDDILGFNQIDSDENIEDDMQECVDEHTLKTTLEVTTQKELPEFDGDTSRANPNFRPRLPKPIHHGEASRQLIMDTETTGLDPNKGDRIIEVGIVELIGRKFTGEKLHVYINPERGMDEEVIRIHGISEAFLADKPTFAQVAQSLYDFMAGAEIIAHNAPFDMGFLSMEFDKVGLKDFAQKVQVTDSLTMAKQQYPGQKNTLDALVRRLNVGKQDRTFHGALLDAEILAEVYLAMTGGQVSLAIDEVNMSEEGGSHASFAHLANQLIHSITDENAHQSWLGQLSEDYPELVNKWC